MIVKIWNLNDSLTTVSRRLLTCWAQERRFRLWSPIILQPERPRLKFQGSGTAFRCIPAYFNPWVCLGYRVICGMVSRRNVSGCIIMALFCYNWKLCTFTGIACSHFTISDDLLSSVSVIAKPLYTLYCTLYRTENRKFPLHFWSTHFATLGPYISPTLELCGTGVSPFNSARRLRQVIFDPQRVYPSHGGRGRGAGFGSL